jgi:chromate transporter
LGWLYSRLAIGGTWLGALFLGVQAAVLAVIVRALQRIGQHVLHDRWLWAAAVLSGAATLGGASFWIVLPAAGAFYALASGGKVLAAAAVLVGAAVLSAVMLEGSGSLVGGAVAGTAAPGTLALFVAGLKGGLLTFGGAYTAIPFVRDDTVGRGWMSDGQFLDGLALTGLLPAPLVIFVTFVGWICGGLAGAVAITVGMFLPAFAFSLLFYERLEAVAEHQGLRHVLAGVAAGVVGLIAVTLVELAAAAIARTPNLRVSIAIFVVGLVVAFRWRSALAAPTVLALGAVAGVAALSGG